MAAAISKVIGSGICAGMVIAVVVGYSYPITSSRDQSDVILWVDFSMTLSGVCVDLIEIYSQ
jgi:hypothetical protein